MTLFDQVLSRLPQPKKDGEWYTCFCPAHEASGNGHHASLRLRAASQVDDGLIVTCMAGCSRDDLQSALQLPEAHAKTSSTDGNTHLFWVPAPQPGKRIVATHDYTDESGEVLFQKVRFHPKEFVQRRPFEGRWVWGLSAGEYAQEQSGDWRKVQDWTPDSATRRKFPAVRQVLYRLPEVLAADTVVVAEGEKAADALRSLGLTATCGSSGAGKWRSDYGEHLEGKRVIVCPDADEQGRKHGEIVIAALRKVGIDCCTLLLPDLPDKGDPYDAVQSGLTLERFETLAGEAFARREEKAAAEAIREMAQEYRLTEGGNAERFAAQHKTVVASVPGRGLLVYSGGVFVDDKMTLMRCARETVLSLYGEAASSETETKRRALAEHARRSDNSRARAGMITLAAAEETLEVPSSSFDADPELLCARNGIVDLRRGTLHEHSPDARMTKKTGADYSGRVDCSTWLGHLRRIFDGDDDLIGFVQRLFGYALTGYTREQMFAVFFGHGANGKSVTLHLMERAMGDYARSASAKTFSLSSHGEQRNDLARLEGARLVTTFETTSSTTLDEEMVKQLTGGDRLVTRFLHQEFFEYTPQFLIVMSTNHKPMVEVADYAIKRRVLLVPFEVTIPESEQDRELERKLCDELSGILSWAVAGAVDYLSGGLQIPDVVSAATEKARDELDPLHGFRDLVTLDEHSWTSSASVRKAVEKWAHEEGMKQVPSAKELKPWLERLGATYHRRRDGSRGWSGVSIDGQDAELKLTPDNDDR